MRYSAGLQNIRRGGRPCATGSSLGACYKPPRVNDPEVVQRVLLMLTADASGEEAAEKCGVTTQVVSCIRRREAKRRAVELPRPRSQRAKYERPYTPEQRARKKGLMR